MSDHQETSSDTSSLRSIKVDSEEQQLGLGIVVEDSHHRGEEKREEQVIVTTPTQATSDAPETAEQEPKDPTSATDSSESLHSVKDDSHPSSSIPAPTPPPAINVSPIMRPSPLPTTRSFGSQRSLTSSSTTSPSPPVPSPSTFSPPTGTREEISSPTPPHSKHSSMASMESVTGLDEVPLDVPASPPTIPTPPIATPKASIFSTFGVTLRKTSTGAATAPTSSPSSSLKATKIPPPSFSRSPSSSSVERASPKPAPQQTRTPSATSWKTSFAGMLPTALGGVGASTEQLPAPDKDKDNGMGALYPMTPSSSSSRPVGIFPSMMTSPSPSAATSKSNSQDRSLQDPSTSFLLHNLQSISAIRKRSDSIGGGAAIRDSFEKVRDRQSVLIGSAGSGIGSGSGSGGGKRDSELVRQAEEFDVGGDHDHDHSQEESLEGEGLAEGDEYGSKGKEREREGSVGRDGVDWQFWGAVVGDYEEVARTRPKDLSTAIQRGIPDVIRGTIWQLMSSSKSSQLEQTYSGLLKQKSPHEKAIQKDIARTFPTHAYFQQGGGVGQENLFNVVKAYSLYDPEVGYTQGLAFIVAALLLNMPDEEAFCVLVRLMESYDLRSHFLPEMPGLQLRLYQFDRLLEELLPVLHLHFVRSRIKSSMYASQWFMTMFSYRFPLSLVYRIFDIVFAEGIEAIFRFSLALMAKNEQVLLGMNFEDSLGFLQGGLFDSYKSAIGEQNGGRDVPDSDWNANRFVTDAYAMEITPFMLDNFTKEWQDKCRILLAHATEMDNLRQSNRNLSNQVQQLELALNVMNAEHVDLAKQLVDSRVEREEIEGELVKYKMLYAELFHSQQDAMSIQHRKLSGMSNGSRG